MNKILIIIYLTLFHLSFINAIAEDLIGSDGMYLDMGDGDLLTPDGELLLDMGDGDKIGSDGLYLNMGDGDLLTPSGELLLSY